MAYEKKVLRKDDRECRLQNGTAAEGEAVFMRLEL